MDNNKNKSSIGKFEEFLLTVYKNETSKVLKEYPTKRSLLIDFNKINQFNSELASLFILKPEDCFVAFSKAIKNINPELDADLNIRIKNIIRTISLENLDSTLVGSFVSTEGIIKRRIDPFPRLDNALFECRRCMRPHEIKQFSSDSIIEPSLCTECGGRSFRLVEEESSFIDSQEIVIKTFETSRELRIVLEDDLVSYDNYNINDFVKINGVLKTTNQNNKNFQAYIKGNYVENNKEELFEFVEEIDDLKDETCRNSAEYNRWMNDVLSQNDSTCIICGETRASHVHHIFSYKNHPDYRLDVNNGVVLCRWCHHKYHDLHGKADANPASLIKFLKEELG